MGVATGRTEERVLASMGQLSEVALKFERCDDVPLGGVLCALPALLAVGLLRRVRQLFSWPKGYYPLESIFLALAFLALAGVRSLERLRYLPPGEWGKLVGLDRIPEVKTMRSKIALLCQGPQAPAQWGSQLAQDWMAANAQEGGFYYVDGHVRVYHGSAVLRPRAYVAREQLCLRATLDYWVNAMDGQPFFVITQDLNERLIRTLQEEIVPRLKAEAPGQPSELELQANRLLHRLVIVFDREGYSPKLFKELLQERIAIVSYAKRCKATEDWPVEEFTQKNVTLINGERVTLWMAERGVRLSNGLWVREVRHRDERGHQTAILSTDFIHSLERVAAALFARWCQENFFRYMMEHYALDRFVQYGAEPIPETSLVVNPARRALESEIRRERGLLSRERAQLTTNAFPPEATLPKAAAFEQQQGQLLGEIRQRESHLAELKSKRETTPKHVPLGELPEAERYTRLPSVSKHFVDTLKMVAYRAETVLVGLAREKMERPEDVRSLVRQVLQSSVNLIPNEQEKTLTVEVHPLANQAHNQVLRYLCAQLTETETVYPTTDLRLVFGFLGPD
jgi:Transposase protein